MLQGKKLKLPKSCPKTIKNAKIAKMQKKIAQKNYHFPKNCKKSRRDFLEGQTHSNNNR